MVYRDKAHLMLLYRQSFECSSLNSSLAKFQRISSIVTIPTVYCYHQQQAGNAVIHFKTWLAYIPGRHLHFKVITRSSAISSILRAVLTNSFTLNHQPIQSFR